MAANQAGVEPAAAPLPAPAAPIAAPPPQIRVVVDNKEVLDLMEQLLKEVRIIRHNVQ